MKKESAIKQMYYGERGSCHNVPLGEQYFRLLDEVVKADDEIRAKLKVFPALFELYEKTNRAIDAMYCELADDHYMEGFKFGVLIGLELGGSH